MRELLNWRVWLVSTLFIGGILLLGGEADSLSAQLYAIAVGLVMIATSVALGRKWKDLILSEDEDKGEEEY